MTNSPEDSPSSTAHPAPPATLAAPPPLMERLRALGPGVMALTIAALALPPLGGFLLLGFSVKLKPWFAEGGVGMIAAFAGAFGVLTGLAILPTYALSFASGVFFGMVWGGGAAVLGVTLGAIIGYAMGSTFARPRVLGQIESDPKATAIRNALLRRSWAGEAGIVTLLRFPPNSPFALTNLVMSSTGVRWPAYLLGTVVGMAPRTCLAAGIGFTVGEVDKITSPDGRWKYIGIGVSVAVFVVLYLIINKRVKEALSKLARSS